MGFGFCFNRAAPSPGKDPCAGVEGYAGDVCPSHGQPRQCQTPEMPEDTACGDIDLDLLECRLTAGCRNMAAAGMHGLPRNNTNFTFATCLCTPTSFPPSYCAWSSQPCDYSPFFPPSPVGNT